MSTQNWSEDIVLINLTKEPDMSNELQTLIGSVRKNPGKDIVIDMSNVDIVSSSSIAKLLKLRKILKQNNHRLVISSVSTQTHKIFELTGLDGVFEFVEDKFIALAGLQLTV
ncbi:MAG: STAS domain-containing protein [Planctomycetes bacterium]|nr:STAS domain-containing protein [Planctomycetota bacterium]